MNDLGDSSLAAIRRFPFVEAVLIPIAWRLAEHLTPAVAETPQPEFSGVTCLAGAP